MKEIKNKIKNSIFGEFNQELIGDKVKLQNKVNKYQRMIDMINYLQPIEEKIEEKEEFVLPEKWYVIGNNQEEYDLISKYVRKNGGSHYTKKENHPLEHIPYFIGKTYETSNFKTSPINRGYTEITFEQFKKYVLNK